MVDALPIITSFSLLLAHELVLVSEGGLAESS